MNANEKKYRARRTKNAWLRYIRLMPQCYWFDAIACKGVDMPVYYPFYKLRCRLARALPLLHSYIWGSYK